MEERPFSFCSPSSSLFGITSQEPFPQSNTQAGYDFQLSLTDYDSAGRACRSIDNLGRANQTTYDD
jgi:hypothetical protein